MILYKSFFAHSYSSVTFTDLLFLDVDADADPFLRLFTPFFDGLVDYLSPFTLFKYSIPFNS
jgi:hypothetical protein